MPPARLRRCCSPRRCTAKPAAVAPTLQGRPLAPAGQLIQDATTHRPAVGALPVAFVRSPESGGPDGHGRYLIAVNSGYGVQFDAAGNRAQQSLAVIDLDAEPPAVVQTVYFPTPQSANIGAVFGLQSDDGSYPFYVAGGFQNVIWRFQFAPGGGQPLRPASRGPDTRVTAPAIDVAALGTVPSAAYNGGQAAVYPAGLAISRDGTTLYSANELGDSLGVVGLGRPPRLRAIPLTVPGHAANVHPYEVSAAVPGKIYVSLWGAGALAVVDPARLELRRYVAVGRHPTVMRSNPAGSRLYVANSNGNSISVVDTRADREIERIDLRLAEHGAAGVSPEGLALSADGRLLYVANAHSNAVAVVRLGAAARGARGTAAARRANGGHDTDDATPLPSRVIGAIPTGLYPSAVAVAGTRLFIGNGKGTGFANSSQVVSGSGFSPNAPNAQFPAEAGTRRGQYSVSLMSGNLSVLPLPDPETLASYTRTVLTTDGLLGDAARPLFAEGSPIQHVIYVIRENRTYDQVLGDVAAAGDGTPADGDPSLAIFGDGAAARHHGVHQNVTPNAHALAARFGLLDRFFVNAEASPDGHNWSTAAFSNDYVDKAYRWNYSGRGRSYDFEGFNRLPELTPPAPLPEALRHHPDAGAVAAYLKRYVPYLQGGRDIAEPESLYLWDAAARAGLDYRNYGEFVGTVSAADVAALRARQPKAYPDTSRVAASFATKRALASHFAPAFPNFDLAIPDVMTVSSYRAARKSGADPAITARPGCAFPGTSRFGAWLDEFAGFVADRRAGRGDRLPALSIVRFSSDHTAGLHPGMPTPQFMVADNDYALGRLVDAVSHSPYWRDTAIFVVEDDAQAGPDHVDAHRSPALVISAYSRPGALVHDYHDTVSLVRTIERLLGLAPMNELDAIAAPIRIFRGKPDLRPYQALLPELAADNLLTPAPNSRAAAYWSARTAEQDLAHADMADPQVLNRAIWFSVRGDELPPAPRHLPVFALMLPPADPAEDEDERVAEHLDVDRHRARLAAVLALIEDR